MVEKRKKLKFVKTKSPSKNKKEYDHISKEASKTDSEDSSNFFDIIFKLENVTVKISNSLKVRRSASSCCCIFSRWFNSFSK